MNTSRFVLLAALIACLLVAAPVLSFAAEIYKGNMVTGERVTKSGGFTVTACIARELDLRVEGSKVIYKVNGEDFSGDLRPDGSFKISDRWVIKGGSSMVHFTMKGNIVDGAVTGDVLVSMRSKDCPYTFHVPKNN